MRNKIYFIISVILFSSIIFTTQKNSIALIDSPYITIKIIEPATSTIDTCPINVKFSYEITGDEGFTCTNAEYAIVLFNQSGPSYFFEGNLTVLNGSAEINHKITNQKTGSYNLKIAISILYSIGDMDWSDYEEAYQQFNLLSDCTKGLGLNTITCVFSVITSMAAVITYQRRKRK